METVPYRIVLSVWEYEYNIITNTAYCVYLHYTSINGIHNSIFRTYQPKRLPNFTAMDCVSEEFYLLGHNAV
jgi:hypothetical protein